MIIWLWVKALVPSSSHQNNCCILLLQMFIPKKTRKIMSYDPSPWPNMVFPVFHPPEEPSPLPSDRVHRSAVHRLIARI